MNEADSFIKLPFIDYRVLGIILYTEDISMGKIPYLLLICSQLGKGDRSMSGLCNI